MATDYSDTIVLLARQRSGTNALRSILDTHDDVFCFNEVFKLAARDSQKPLPRHWNFFTFVESYARGDVTRIFPDNHETLFQDFLEYLRCFSAKRYKLIDVKYNMTHFMTAPWTASMHVPGFLQFVTRYEIKVLNVTRKNYLRGLLSTLKAWRSGTYTVTSRDRCRDTTRRLDLDHLFDQLDRWHEEDRIIEKHFASYPYFLAYDYADIFPGTEPIAQAFLETVALWLDIPNRFCVQPRFEKQSILPLPEAIENWAEVEQALRGTRFEYCLEDEPAYRRRKPRVGSGSRG